MSLIWQCKRCNRLYEGSQLAEREHGYGGVTLREKICPRCRSALLTCISTDWKLNFVDDERWYRNPGEDLSKYSDAESTIKRYISDVENLIDEQEK